MGGGGEGDGDGGDLDSKGGEGGYLEVMRFMKGRELLVSQISIYISISIFFSFQVFFD